MALGLPEDIAEILANEDIEYPLLAERIVAVGIPPSAPAHVSQPTTNSFKSNERHIRSDHQLYASHPARGM